MPRTPAEVLTRMRSVSTSSPRLVWHGADGRIELSGRVFDNWVAKSANLLVDELDATASTRISLDLPPHWKTLALAFACWQVGAVVVLDAGEAPGDGPATGGDTDDADIVLTSRERSPLDPPRLLACVALGSLALRWDGPLPRGAVDYAAEVRSHGDVFFGDPLSPKDDDAVDPVLVVHGGRAITARELPAPLGIPAADGSAGPATVLLEAGTDPLRTLAVALTVWQEEGTLVLVEDGVPVTDRMLAGERVTDRLGPS